MSETSESGDSSVDRPDLKRLDTGTAHIARVYDYWLGGTDNFAADRAAGEEALEAFPGLISSVRANHVSIALIGCGRHLGSGGVIMASPDTGRQNS